MITSVDSVTNATGPAAPCAATSAGRYRATDNSSSRDGALAIAPRSYEDAEGPGSVVQLLVDDGEQIGFGQCLGHRQPDAVVAAIEDVLNGHATLTDSIRPPRAASGLSYTFDDEGKPSRTCVSVVCVQITPHAVHW